MVETAHPRLREAWAATGALTAADFDAAFNEHAPYSVRRSLLGDVDDMPASDCGDDRKRAGAEWCFNGTDPGDIDDDWARADLMGLHPGACATCGFSDSPTGDSDCITCKNGGPVTKVWDDGTGRCAQ